MVVTMVALNCSVGPQGTIKTQRRDHDKNKNSGNGSFGSVVSLTPSLSTKPKVSKFLNLFSHYIWYF